MAETHDTFDGLLAEFRGYAAGMPPSYHVTMSWADFRKMLDRIEAAHKRESVTDRNQFGDAAKLREALVRFYEWAILDLNENAWIGDSSGNYKKLLDAMAKEIAAALAAPPRNCDVGTAEEQVERWNNESLNPYEWGDRQYLDAQEVLEWAQMPYEEGGAK